MRIGVIFTGMHIDFCTHARHHSHRGKKIPGGVITKYFYLILHAASLIAAFIK